MILSQKIRIFPTKQQKSVLWDLSEKCRLVYNFALKERKERWNDNKNKPKNERVYITYKDQQNQLPELKKKFPEYKWVYSKVLQAILKKLDSNFKSFFTLWNKGDKKVRPPKFKGKKYFSTLCYNQSGFRIENNKINFSHKHPSRIILEFTLLKNLIPKGKIKQVEIYLNNQKYWFVLINYEIKIPKYTDNGLYQAFDLGVNQTVGVNIYSKVFKCKHKRADLYWKKRISEVESKRDHCNKFSNKWKWYNDKRNRMIKKRTNQLKDHQHWLSKQIVENTKANTIIIGDLNIKQMARKKKGTGNRRKTKANKTLNHSIHNLGYMRRFVQFLTYKAELLGKRVIRIDESYTTQTCCRCGKKTKRKLSERIICCDCGNLIDRDLNSAINIMGKFLNSKKNYDYLLQERSVNEQSFLNCWKGFSTINSLINENNGLVGSHCL